MAFHPHVEQIREYYLEMLPDDKKSKTARKLIVPTDDVYLPTLEKMWLAVYKAHAKRYEINDPAWAHCFVEGVFYASTFPPYFLKSALERREAVQKIEKLTKDLSKVLKENDLDFHLVRPDGKIFNGFYFYEGFSEKSQKGMDENNTDKLKVSFLLENLAREVTERISYAYTSAKAGKKMKEIRFIRSLAKNNKEAYGSPLNAVIAAAVFATYGVEYKESDIANLLNRRVKREDQKKVIARLARLSLLDYAFRRGSEAETLGIHVSMLDEAVSKVRSNKEKIS